MATHDYIISNASGAAVRADLNNALAAIATNNSSATEPTTTYAYQWWADTGSSPTVMKLRNAANSGWVTLFQLDGEWSLIPFENGTAAAPSIYFKDSGTDTGLFSPGVDQVGITTGGAVRLTTSTTAFTGTLPWQGQNGTAAAPALSFSGDPNSGVYNVGADDVGISTNGTLRFDVSTTATTSTLPVVHPLGAVGTPSVTFTGDLNTGIWSPAADTIAASTNGSERLRITSTGLVGIGTVAPAQKLEIQDGSISVGSSVNTSTTNVLLAGYGYVLTGTKYGNTSIRSTYSSVDNSASLDFYVASGSTSTNERMRLDSSGRLLVGTTSSPSNAQGSLSKLIVQGYVGADTEVGILSLQRGEVATSITANEAIGQLAFNSSDGGTFAHIQASADAIAGNNDYPGRLVFSTTADGASSPTERVRITQTGHLKCSNSGAFRNATGAYHEFRQNNGNDNVLWLDHIASSGGLGGISINYTAQTPNNTTNSFIACADATATRFDFRSNGGIANFQANNVNLSDRNAKKDISLAAGTWDCIKEWEIVNYRYKDQPDDADLNLGVIAQQVAESCPEVITVFQEAKEATEDKPAQEERLGIKEQQMYWMAIKALQEAQARIETLEAKVAALEAN